MLFRSPMYDIKDHTRIDNYSGETTDTPMSAANREALRALATIATDLHTSHGVVFLHSMPGTPTWTRRRWRIEPVRTRVEHLLASSAIPVFFPSVVALGYDPVWFGIIITINIEIAAISPPVGFNLFVLQGMTGRQLGWIARVTLPMFWVMVAAVLLLYWFPEIATWLPSRMMR